MSEIVLNVVQYSIMVIDSVAAAMLFSSFSKTKQKPKTLLFVIIATLLSFLISFLPIDNNYFISMLMVLAFLGLSLLFQLKMPMRVFLICCFWSAKEICLFASLGPRTIVNNVAYDVINRMAMNEPLIPLAEVRQYFNVSLTISELVSTVAYFVMLLVILHYIVKSFIDKNAAMRRTETLHLILPCISGIAVTQMLRYVFNLPAEAASVALNSTPLTGFLIPAAGILFLLGMAASVKLYQSLKYLQAEETGKKVLEKQIVQIKEQVKDVQDVYADIRGIRHDMANHLSNIRLLIQAGTENQEELHDYIGKLEVNLEALRFDYRTGNPITDVILRAKALDAKSRGIAFDYDFKFPPTLTIDSVDVAVILCNTLDNALEACEAVPEGKRFIRLCAYKKGAMLFIETENSFRGKLRFNENTGLPESNKPDGAAHGIGLTNIKRCAEKNFGGINIAEREGVFQLTVMLQGKV